MSSKNPATVLTVKVGTNIESTLTLTGPRAALDWAVKQISNAVKGKAVFVWKRHKLCAAYAAGRVVARNAKEVAND